MKKYDKIYIIGHEENKDIFSCDDDNIYIKEKIDGGNFRFMIHNGEIIFGSRTQEISEKYINAKNFLRCMKFVRDKLKDKDLKLLEGRVFFGENCVRHTMAYDWENIPPFLGFDIYCLKNEKYLAEKNTFYVALGLPTVPLLKCCTAKEARTFKEEDIPKTKYPSPSAENQLAEGVVFKNYKKQIFAKLVRDKFKEDSKKAFGLSKKWAKNDSETILAMYCTNARIDKMIFKLIDEGHKSEMSMMHHLPKRVYRDIMEEHWQDVVLSKYTIDFKNLNKLVTNRCLSVLKQVIQNNVLNKDK